MEGLVGNCFVWIGFGICKFTILDGFESDHLKNNYSFKI